ncbi:MAG: family 10 glycosylhydrolase [Planctomycetota bacterium]
MPSPRRLPTAALLAAALAGPTLASAGPAAASDAPEAQAFADHRGVWVSRFEYSSAASIQNVIQRAADAGFTDIYWQVRGQGDALYDSNVEVWDARYPRSGPGFDPLQVAVDAAETHGVKLSAWINTVPMWNGAINGSPPSDPFHLYNLAPDWRLKDFNGNDQPLGSSYTGINVTHPDARAHIASVVDDIASRYDVEGVHLDYIRMVNNTSGSPIQYPLDPDTRARYEAETGNTFTSGASAAYKQWLADGVTAVVSESHAALDNLDPDLKLTAAVWRDYDIGTNSYQQQADRWVEDATLDAAHAMIYTSDMALYENNLYKYKSLDAQAGVYAGIGSYLHLESDPDLTLEQLRMAQAAGANGYTIFSYSSIYSGSQLTSIGQDVADFNATLDARRDANLKGMALTDFEDGEGFFQTSPELSGSNVNIDAAAAFTTNAESYDGTTSQQIDITPLDSSGWLLRHLAGDGSTTAASPDANLQIISDGYLGFWLKTTDPGLQVSVAVDDVEGTAERGLFRDVIADGDWHLYEWNLGDDADWNGWVLGDGLIEGQSVTLDSIQFTGDTAATVYLDNISFNPFGSLFTPPPTPGDLDDDGDADADDIVLLLASYGDPAFDLTDDGLTDDADLAALLALMGTGPADANLDGNVNTSDLAILAAGFATLVDGWAQADFNGDGIVNTSDLALLASNFDNGAPLSAATAAVPEPATLSLAALASLATLRRRRNA